MAVKKNNDPIMGIWEVFVRSQEDDGTGAMVDVDTFLGETTEDGITFETESEFFDLVGARKQIKRKYRLNHKGKITYSLLEWDDSSLELVLPGEEVVTDAEGNKSMTVYNHQKELLQYAKCFVLKPKDELAQLVGEIIVYKGLNISNLSLEMKVDAPTVLGFEIEMYEDENRRIYKFMGENFTA